MMVPHAESRDPVVRIGNDAAAAREFAHLQALRRDVGNEARADLGFGVGMQVEFDAGCIGRALPRVVIGSGADAAETEDDIVGGERTLERRGDQRGFVGQILAPGEFQAALAERGDDLRHMLVLAFAGHDFIADDDCAKLHG